MIAGIVWMDIHWCGKRMEVPDIKIVFRFGGISAGICEGPGPFGG